MLPPRSTKALVAQIDRITTRLSIADADYGTLRPSVTRVVKELCRLRPPPTQSESARRSRR